MIPWAASPVALAPSEDDLKRRFAQLLHERPDNPFERMNAAKLLFPRQDQVALALNVAQDWPSDPVVIAELDRLKASGSEHNLPSKFDIARRYINIADDKQQSLDARLKALNAYAELMGMKPQQGIGLGGIGINIDNRRVFVLPQQAGSLEDWEKGAQAQQAKLVEGSARRK